MQLSPKEQAVKQHLIDRLQGDVMLRQTFSGLSYVEKKHVVEELDRVAHSRRLDERGGAESCG